MLRYLFRRILEGIPTIAIVIIITFLLIHLAPGDPVSYMAGISADEKYLEEARHKLGLDRPLSEQLIAYIGRLLRGDFGYSLSRHKPVIAIIMERLPATLLLMATSFLISSAGGIVLGAFAARHPYSKMDNLISIFSLLMYSMPKFWLGMILLLVFGIWLDLFPIQGMRSVGIQLTGWQTVLDTLMHLSLPALALGISEMAVFFRMTRASMLEIIELDFIATARSKGLTEKRVFLKHGLQNALIPVVTLLGMRLKTLFAGAVLIETIFAWPGIGRLTLMAMQQRDYPLILGIILWAAILVVICNLTADIIYALIDPRVELR